MNIKIVFLLVVAFVLLLFVSNVSCGPILYRIKVDLSDLSGVDVEIVAHTEEPTVRVAMAAHPEYHDRYFRYIENFSAESNGRRLTFTKPEEAVWQIEGVSGRLTVRYRVAFNPKEREWRQTWKPHLSPTGGMIGDLHTLMYIVGQEKHPALLTLDMPAGWKAVSGLEPTDDPRKFVSTVELLLDSPILIGDVKEWKFTAGGVSHTVAIWSPTNERVVDPGPIVSGIQKLAEKAISAFGKPPYPRYAFLLENGGQAALEHRTSLNAAVRPDLEGFFDQIGHEYVHVWNLMDVRPRERVGLKHRFADPTNVLWWSEGATIMFSDLLIRRAGLDSDRQPRIRRLESLLARYLSAPGYWTLSAEHVSRGDSHPELLGDNWAGTHLQGEVLNIMLDILIRDATDGRRNLDDVMSTLSARFDFEKGITNADIERSAADVCACRVDDFFQRYVYNPAKVDLDRYLALIGMRAEIASATAVDSDGRPSLDLRIAPISTEGELKLRITNTNSGWFRSGVRTGDKLVSINGDPANTWQLFREKIRIAKVGDTIRLIVERDRVAKTIDVELKPFEIPTVRIIEIEGATPRQSRLRKAWTGADSGK